MDGFGATNGFAHSNRLEARLHDAIPGGAHTYARGADQYPEGMAPVLVRGKGAHVWDVDGNRYVEYGMGLRAVTLGHAYEPVVDAVRSVLGDGVSFTRPTQLELQAAEEFLAALPDGQMVKFGKHGSDATTAAVKLARAVTGRDLVAITGQPFHSVDDWFIATTAMNAGIPQAHRDLTVTFRYNDLASLEALFAEHGGRIACVLLEPATTMAEPAPGFLEGVRALCDRHGALLVFDEIITGFRWAFPSAAPLYGVRADLTCFGKGIGNGFPISALAGRRDVMELGGLRTDARRVFLLSTTNGPETVSLAALRAVLQAYRSWDPIAVMQERGQQLADGVNDAARELGVDGHVRAAGRPSCLVFTTAGPDGSPSQEYRTLFLQHLLAGGVLGQSFVISAAHTVADVDHTIEVARAAMLTYRKALEAGTVLPFLAGRSVAPALRAHAHPRRLA